MQKKWDIPETTVSLCRNWESWAGSYYELSMAYNGTITRHDALHLLQWLWDDPSLLGIVEDPDEFGHVWHPLEPSSMLPGRHLYGYLRFPHGQILGCASQYTFSESGTWLTVYVPLGMLELVFPVHYPVMREENLWMTQVDEFLARIGARISKEFPFLIAVMGEEAAAFPLQSILTTIAHNPGLLVPETTFRQVHVHPYGIRVENELWWTGERGKNREQTQ